MLRICRCYSELNISGLLAVYEGSITGSKKDRFYAEQDLCDYLRDDFFKIPGSFCAVWCDDDRYVSALRMEPYKDGFLLSGLETAPLERRRGYGAALVEAVCNLSAPVYAHVHRANRQSCHLHKRCGFVEVLDYGILLDGTVSRQYVTLCYKNTPASN